MKLNNITATINTGGSVTEEDRERLKMSLMNGIFDRSDYIFDETRRMGIYRNVISILAIATAIAGAVWAGYDKGYTIYVLLYPITVLMYILTMFTATDMLILNYGRIRFALSAIGFITALVLTETMNPFSIPGLLSLIAGTFLATVDSNLYLEENKMLDYTVVYSGICDQLDREPVPDEGIDRIFKTAKATVKVKGIFKPAEGKAKEAL